MIVHQLSPCDSKGIPQELREVGMRVAAKEFQHMVDINTKKNGGRSCGCYSESRRVPRGSQRGHENNMQTALIWLDAW